MRPSPGRTRATRAVLLAGAVAVLTACGSAADPAAPSSSPEPSAAAYPMTVTAANGPVTIPARPARIVSLSPTATETLFAVGAGDQVTAVDDRSSHPEQAPRTALSSFKPNVEAVAAEDPDLVIVANDTDGVVAGLAKLKIPTLLEPAPTTLDGAYRQIEQIAAATGHDAEGRALTARMKQDIAAVVAATPKRDLTFYHELDPNLYSVTSKTFIGSFYALFGLRNIADEAQGAAGDYPQLSAEFVLAEDPDLIFLADTRCCRQSPATVAARPGWSELAAVRGDRVVPLDDDIASRWGPRVVDFVRAIAARLPAVATPTPTG